MSHYEFIQNYDHWVQSNPTINNDIFNILKNTNKSLSVEEIALQLEQEEHIHFIKYILLIIRKNWTAWFKNYGRIGCYHDKWIFIGKDCHFNKTKRTLLRKHNVEKYIFPFEWKKISYIQKE